MGQVVSVRVAVNGGEFTLRSTCIILATTVISHSLHAGRSLFWPGVVIEKYEMKGGTLTDILHKSKLENLF